MGPFSAPGIHSSDASGSAKRFDRLRSDKADELFVLRFSRQGGTAQKGGESLIRLGANLCAERSCWPPSTIRRNYRGIFFLEVEEAKTNFGTAGLTKTISTTLLHF